MRIGFSGELKKGILLGIAATLLVIFGFVLGTSVLSSRASSQLADYTPVALAAQGGPVLSSLEQTYADVYNQVGPSVVAINVVARQQGFGGAQLVQGSGSGFVIDTQGHIVTNNHVVQGATDIEVSFLDGTIVRAAVVGTDPDSDLAVIQVNVPTERLQPVQFGDVDQLVVGQQVLAIGSPFGQRWTLTAGIISALDRTIQGLTDYSIGSVIQTDAPINPGNSGGPLLNLAGQVVGVNSQILSAERQNSGVGFAIPSNLILRVANELIEQGEVTYSYIGISGGDMSLAVIEALDLPNDLRGVVVGTAPADGPAGAAGLRNANVNQQTGEILSADVITAIDGQPILTFDTLVAYLARNTAPGDTVTLTVYRDGGFFEIPVMLSARP
jgi:2-alkenal reductase